MSPVSQSAVQTVPANGPASDWVVTSSGNPSSRRQLARSNDAPSRVGELDAVDPPVEACSEQVARSAPPKLDAVYSARPFVDVSNCSSALIVPRVYRHSSAATVDGRLRVRGVERYVGARSRRIRMTQIVAFVDDVQDVRRVTTTLGHAVRARSRGDRGVASPVPVRPVVDRVQPSLAQSARRRRGCEARSRAAAPARPDRRSPDSFRRCRRKGRRRRRCPPESRRRAWEATYVSSPIRARSIERIAPDSAYSGSASETCRRRAHVRHRALRHVQTLAGRVEDEAVRRVVVPRSRKPQHEVSPCPALRVRGTARRRLRSSCRSEAGRSSSPSGYPWVAGGDVDERRLGRACDGYPRHEPLLDSREPGSGRGPARGRAGLPMPSAATTRATPHAAAMRRGSLQRLCLGYGKDDGAAQASACICAHCRSRRSNARGR